MSEPRELHNSTTAVRPTITDEIFHSAAYSAALRIKIRSAALRQRQLVCYLCPNETREFDFKKFEIREKCAVPVDSTDAVDPEIFPVSVKCRNHDNVEISLLCNKKA